MTNMLLAAMVPEEFSALEPDLETVGLEFRQHLYRAGKPIEHAVFVDSGVASMVNEPAPGEIVEVATVGREGMVGLPMFLGEETSPSSVFIQVAGRARRLTAAGFCDAVDRFPSLRRVMMKYTMALLNQIAQGASCNRLHEVQERCARWLLQTHDRVGGDRFAMTQEFLAMMLGVHRPTVSLAAAMLQKAGLITYWRGSITILDRPGLEGAACPCYRLIRNEYERLLGCAWPTGR